MRYTKQPAGISRIREWKRTLIHATGGDYHAPPDEHAGVRRECRKESFNSNSRAREMVAYEVDNVASGCFQDRLQMLLPLHPAEVAGPRQLVLVMSMTKSQCILPAVLDLA